MAQQIDEDDPLLKGETDRLKDLLLRIEHPTEWFAVHMRHFNLEVPWFHRVWYDAMDDPALKRVFIMGPRLHAKTSCALTYVVRRLAQDHHLRVGILSQTDELAKHFLAEVKHELDNNTDLLRQFGPSDGRPFRGDTWQAHQIVLSDAREGPGGISGKDVSVFSVGRGGQITGYHCDLLVVDDLETKEGTDSDTVRQGTREWWSREVEPVLSAGGKIVATGTRKHFDDIYAYWLAPNSGWDVIDVVKSVWTDDGEPIWPEMWSKELLAVRKAAMDQQDLLAWPVEYLNEPRPSETQMFHPEDWPTYGGEPHDFARRQQLAILQFWDLAISEKTTADYTVGWTIGVNDDNDIFLLERRRGHWDFNTTLGQIQDMGLAWPGVERIGIEQVAYQAAAVQEALRRSMLPVVPVIPDKDKVTRARLLEARAAAGKVYRPEHISWWPEFAQEALFFPAGSHDDQIDSLAGGVRMAGFEAQAISWAYNVWTCRNPVCKFMFMYEAGRPCPQCGRQCPAEYENPELLAYAPQKRPNIPAPEDATVN
jgi:predicted phage terminase large subunit-like protein